MQKTQTHTSNTSTIHPPIPPYPGLEAESVRKEAIERRGRIDSELDKGFEIINKYGDTVTIFGSARFSENNVHYQKAREIAAALAKEGYTIATGGGGGIMEAGNRGAFEANGQSLGFNIKLPHEQVLNKYTTESMPFRYFFTRKVILAYDAKAYVYFPGGYGTLDELFEVITLIQTGKMDAAPVILVGAEFWGGLHSFITEHLLAGDTTISEGDEQLYTITDDTEEIVKIINAYRDSGRSSAL